LKGKLKPEKTEDESQRIMRDFRKTFDWTQTPPFPPGVKLGPGVWDRKSKPPEPELKPVEIKKRNVK
jgi:hypothetical protein